jgi:Ca2+/H+ antiporter
MASGKLAAVMRPSLKWFLVFVPISVYLEHFHSQAYLWIFFSACVAIIPLAGLLGEATEHIAEYAGEGIGGLLNATFGNAFVVPLLVFLSYVIAPQPMDLVFTRGEVLAVILSTFMMAFAAGDGRSNWFMGAQLLAVYLILAVAFYFTPG